MRTKLLCITSEGELLSWCFINICIHILDALHWGSICLALKQLHGLWADGTAKWEVYGNWRWKPLFFFFLFPSFLIKLNWCPNHPKLLCLNFPVLLDGYNNTDVFRNILGDSWGREECQLRNGHQHLYCCYYLYYLIYIMSWHLNVCSVKWSWMQSEVSRRENASIPVKKQFRHRSAQM